MEHRYTRGYRSMALILLAFGWVACATPQAPSSGIVSSTDSKTVAPAAEKVAAVAEKLPPVAEQPSAYPFFW